MQPENQLVLTKWYLWYVVINCTSSNVVVSCMFIIIRASAVVTVDQFYAIRHLTIINLYPHEKGTRQQIVHQLRDHRIA